MTCPLAIEAESTVLLSQMLRENGNDLVGAFVALCQQVPTSAVESPEFQKAIATELLSIALAQKLPKIMSATTPGEPSNSGDKLGLWLDTPAGGR